MRHKCGRITLTFSLTHTKMWSHCTFHSTRRWEENIEITEVTIRTKYWRRHLKWETLGLGSWIFYCATKFVVDFFRCSNIPCTLKSHLYWIHHVSKPVASPTDDVIYRKCPIVSTFRHSSWNDSWRVNKLFIWPNTAMTSLWTLVFSQ